jgi:hypothetical protein
MNRILEIKTRDINAQRILKLMGWVLDKRKGLIKDTQIDVTET